MSRLDRALVALLWCLGVLLVAAAAHILVVFNLPRLERQQGIARLAALTPASGLALLPRVALNAEWAPYADPALAQGACRFDLSKTPMRLRGAIAGDKMLTLSFRTPSGDIFYSMTDRAALRGAIDVLILTPDQLETLEAEADEEEPAPQELRLVAPTMTGFVLVNALAAYPGERGEADDRVRAISCEAETAPEAPAP